MKKTLDEEEPTAEDMLRQMSPDDFKKAGEVYHAVELERARAERCWTCLNCGNQMGYAYIEEGDFDQEGCSACGHPEAIENVISHG